MAALPAAVKEAWEQREGPVVLATVNTEGQPNIIYVSCVSLYGDERLVVADNYFDKTRKNIEAGSKGAALFMTKDKKPYQLKGQLEYHRAGPVFDDMKKWNPPKHPGHAALALVVEEVYSGAKRVS
ncbi:MAG: pyridoxamine 5'-phosphate oxidase family protein [Kiritimatiellae bacterium]|nr:pyridoxamine 5'-phosphate oxidase family protein [Kiritimatiellia bacterium]